MKFKNIVIYSIWLAVIIITIPCFFATIAYANTSNNTFLYELNDDGTATITEYLGSDDEIIFPSEIDGYKVTAIGKQIFATWDSEYYKDNNSYHKIKSVIIENGITTIKESAFYNCRDLSYVSLPNTLTEIEPAAFWGCVSLTDITVPKNTDISCSFLGNSVDFDDYNPDSDTYFIKYTDGMVIRGYENSNAQTYARLHHLKFVPLTDKTKTPKEDFVYELNDDGTATITEYLGSDDEITFPSEIDGYKVTAIGENILATGDSLYYIDNNSYHKIKSVIIENGITTIKDSAFYNCRDLSYVSLPDTLVKIEPFAFMGCVSLTDITVPKNTDINWSYLGNSIDFDRFDPNSDQRYIKDTDNMIIRGYENSSAQTYARLYHFTFIPLDNETTDPTEETLPTITSETTDSTTEVTSTTMSEPTTLDEPTSPTLIGDTDVNGVVELADLTMLSKYLLNETAFPLKNAIATANADMNSDGLINTVDLSALINNQLGK